MTEAHRAPVLSPSPCSPWMWPSWLQRDFVGPSGKAGTGPSTLSLTGAQRRGLSTLGDRRRRFKSEVR
jgi:hypothetical protein